MSSIATGNIPLEKIDLTNGTSVWILYDDSGMPIVNEINNLITKEDVSILIDELFTKRISELKGYKLMYEDLE